MRIEISGIETEVPKGWVDASTVVFQEEANTDNTAAHISIDWGLGEGIEVKDALQKSLAHLPLLIPEFATEEEGTLAQAPKIHFAIYALERPRRVRQMVLVRKVGGHLVTLRCKCAPEAFAAHRADFEKAAQSLVLDAGADA